MTVDSAPDRGAVPGSWRVGRFVLDWFPVFLVLFAYDAIHNRLGPFLPRPHTFPQIHVDQALFGRPIPILRLQHALYSVAHPHWWDFAALAIYTSHFFVPLSIAVVLWFRARARYLSFVTWFVTLTTLGYLTYIVFPAVPPWLASLHGDLAPTHRLVRELWQYLGYPGVANLFSESNVYANDVAAIPSLHAAYPLLTAAIFWRGAHPMARAGLVLYPIVMALTLVYAAEHYVVDILLGWLYVPLTALLLRRRWGLKRGTATAA